MVAAAVGVALLGGLAVLQLLLVAGAPLGRFAWGGAHVVLPRTLRIGSAVSVALYAVFALLMLQAAGALAVLPRGLAGAGIWVGTVWLAVGVGMNAVSPSRAERLLMTPTSVVLAVVGLVLALH
jgi:hypothetical protein